MRLEASHENMVAVMTMGGKRPEVVLSLSRNSSELQRKLFEVQMSGTTADPLTTIRIAQLITQAKKRKNKNLKMRLMIFLGSVPSNATNEQARLLDMVDKLRKIDLKLDIVAFGSLEETQQICSMFQPLINGLGNGSQMVIINKNKDFIDTIFNKLDSLAGLGRLDMPGMWTTTINEEADEDLMKAIMMSLQETNKVKNQTTDPTVSPASDGGKDAKSSGSTPIETPSSSPIKSMMAKEKVVKIKTSDHSSSSVSQQSNPKSLTPSSSIIRSPSKETKTTNGKADTSLVLHDDPAKRRVKRTTKQSFDQFVRSLNAKTNVSGNKTAKRSQSPVKRQTPVQSRNSTQRNVMKRTPDGTSAIGNQVKTEMVKKISRADFLNNLQAKLIDKCE